MTITTTSVPKFLEEEGTTACEEEEVGGAATFGRQGATPPVRRRVAALCHTTLASDTTGMRERPRNPLNSRDVCNASTPPIKGFFQTHPES